MEEIIYKLTKNEMEVILEASKNLNILEISKKTNLGLEELSFIFQTLCEKKILSYEVLEKKYIKLDKLGEIYLRDELCEFQLLNEIKNKSIFLSNLKLEKEVVVPALGEVKRRKLAKVTKKDNNLLIEITLDGCDFLKNYKNPLKNFENKVQFDLLNSSQKKFIEDFKFRKRIFKEENLKTESIKLLNFGFEVAKNLKNKKLELMENLSYDILKNKLWVGKEFRHYDIDVKTSQNLIGREHPTYEVNKILSDVFIEMGFSEMRGPLIESAFWNMDVMWIPQDHPARDEQDTFYLEGKCDLPEKLINKVSQMHEVGIFKSHTDKGEFNLEISKKRLLRTHSTATSFRYLAQLGEKLKKGENVDGKYFYLAQNFRNEAVDATHLAEFFQGEGFIIGDNLSLSDLMGFIKKYLEKLGIKKIKFKPTYNPYTEPSMEAHYYDEKLKKWYSIINSGIFREETLKPLGLEKKRIIAWGFGASRIASILTGVSSMRELSGATCDFDFLKKRKVLKREIGNG